MLISHGGGPGSLIIEIKEFPFMKTKTIVAGASQ